MSVHEGVRDVTLLLASEEGGLAGPSPTAWGYVSPPVYYEKHAIPQWQSSLKTLARREGYALERWFVDTEGRTDGLTSMWSLLPGSGVRALFVPDPRHLRRLPVFKDLTEQQIRDRLPLQVFMLDYDRGTDFAPIVPPGPLPTIIRRDDSPPPKRRHWLRRAFTI